MVKDKIIIFGATGFIGMKLCEDLIKKNYFLIAFTRKKKNLKY